MKPRSSSGTEEVSIRRTWLEHVIKTLQGPLPSGHIGDCVFLLRDQLQDILDRPSAVAQASWVPGEREAVARAIFGDGWQCCADLGPYVQGVVAELNEARELIGTLNEDTVEHQRDLIEQTKGQ